MVGLRDRLYYRRAEPDPAALPVTARVDPGEAAEDPPDIGSRDTGSRVRHGEDDLRALASRAQLDKAVFGSVVDGVLDERIKGEDQPVLVPLHACLRQDAKRPSPGRLA